MGYTWKRTHEDATKQERTELGWRKGAYEGIGRGKVARGREREECGEEEGKGTHRR